MEDFIIREIDRLGEMLLMIARKLGLLDGDSPDYSLADVKDEFASAACPIDLDALLGQENPVWYLVERVKILGLFSGALSKITLTNFLKSS